MIPGPEREFPEIFEGFQGFSTLKKLYIYREHPNARHLLKFVFTQKTNPAMKKVSLHLLLLIYIVAGAVPVTAQNKKLDKALRKMDSYYAAGNFEKAMSTLSKYKKRVLKSKDNSNYLVLYHLKHAQINLALGVVAEFETDLNNAMTTSRAAFGETSTSYATTLMDVADIYLDYGNFRIARELVENAESILMRTNQLSEELKARVVLTKSEAMIGQGFANDALKLLKDNEQYFITRAVEKETIVDGAQIKTRRIPEKELYQRFNEYARLKTLIGAAYAKKGRVSLGIEATPENPDADIAFSELSSWMRNNRKFLGEGSLADLEYRYLWAKAFKDNGNKEMNDARLQFGDILNDLKKKVSPTHALAHDLYINYLELLLEKDSRARFANTRLEYERLIDRYYPKNSLHRVNLKAVEFNAKRASDKTRNLENDAINVISTKSVPKSYKTSIQIYQFLYDVAIADRRYANAEGYLNTLMEIQKDLCGENSPVYHLAKLKLANFYLDYTNRLDDAGKIYDESYLKFVANEVDVRHPAVIDILNHLAQWYEFKDQYALAVKTLKEAKDAAIRKYSNTDILLGMELDQIAKLQLKLGDYDAAEQNILEAIKVINYKENRDYVEYLPAQISVLETQAKLYGIKGLFDDAEDLLDDTRKMIAKSTVPIGDANTTAKELSSLFIQLGRYSATDRLLNDLIVNYEKLFGNTSFRLIEPLVNKGRILLAKGDYTEAANTANRAHQIAASVYGENSTKTAPTQKLLSDIFYTLGDYDKAEQAITKAINSQEKQFTRNHIEVAKSISDLALIKFHKGDDKKLVEKLMLEARDIMEAKLGKDNPQYAEVLKNVAVLYISQRRFDIAFNALTVAEGIWKAKAGKKNNINTASIYTLTGDVYYQLKNYKKAEEFYTKAKRLYETFFSKTHPEYVKILSKLSKVAYMEKDFKSSKRYIEESLNNYEGFIKSYFPALSEREKAKYWNTIKSDFEFYNTLAFSNLEDFRDLTEKVYNYQLLTKALLLSSSIKIRERILNSNDELLKSQYNEWIAKKELLTLALSMSEAQLLENEINPTTLGQEVERLERELSQKSEIFGQDFENKRIQYTDVKGALKPNEVAIEMVRYRYFDHELTDSVIYAVLYLKPEFKKPRAIILPEGHKMETRFFRFYRNAIMGKIPDNVSYAVFWQPIIDEIGQASTIYLSADGVFNQINLEAIPTPDGRYVIDNSNIVLVSNSKDIFLRQTKTRDGTRENTASMFGNPTFYTASVSGGPIPPLPGTEKEIDQLKFILNQKGWTTKEFTEATAAEEKVKELNSPKIFHIATHGLYRPSTEVTLEEQIEGNEAVLAQNPLMRTGLLLRGAGDLLKKTDYNYNMENGILTAYEAMSLNLDKTDLVVLSACETGLGDLEAGEGVYGLQRAFLVAGAKMLIMSMFKVDDDATQKLMLKFYQKWLNTNNMRQSFIDAKKELRVEYPEPIYWGAFMMIGLE